MGKTMDGVALVIMNEGNGKRRMIISDNEGGNPKNFVVNHIWTTGSWAASLILFAAIYWTPNPSGSRYRDVVVVPSLTAVLDCLPLLEGHGECHKTLLTALLPSL